MWHEITVVFTTEFLNEWYPKLCIMLKFLELERINDITQIARDHSISLCPHVELKCRRWRGVPLESSGHRPPILVRRAFPRTHPFALFLQRVIFVEFLVVSRPFEHIPRHNANVADQAVARAHGPSTPLTPLWTARSDHMPGVKIQDSRCDPPPMRC